MANETTTAPVTPEQAQAQALMQFALSNPSIPKIYANACQGFLNAHDVSLLCSVNTVPTGLLQVSYPMAKSLAVLLTELTSKYEDLTGMKIPTTTELDAILKGATDIQAKK
jgi:hypothetical protein